MGFGSEAWAVKSSRLDEQEALACILNHLHPRLLHPLCNLPGSVSKHRLQGPPNASRTSGIFSQHMTSVWCLTSKG